MKIAVALVLAVLLGGIASFGYVRWQATRSCEITFAPVPGILDALTDAMPVGNTELPDGLGHFRAFAVTARFSAAGQFYDGETYRDLTAENASYLCPVPDAVRTDFIHDSDHFAVLCQTPEHIVEADRSFVATDMMIVDDDVMVELFLSDAADVTGDMGQSTCSMARAVRVLMTTYLISQE